MPDIEKTINIKKERLWLTYEAKFKKLLMDPDKDPALVEIRNMVSSMDKVDTKEKQNRSTTKSGCYINKKGVTTPFFNYMQYPPYQ